MDMNYSLEKLTILFAPLDFHGHVNACHGIAETLLQRGHRVVFAIEKEFQSKLESNGFEVLSMTPLWEQQPEFEVEDVSHAVLHKMDIFEQGSLVIIEKFIISNLENLMFKNLKSKSEQYRAILDQLMPDLIIIDSYIGNPVLTESGIPWIWLYSAAPLLIFNNPDLPPPWSGFPTIDHDKSQWIEFRDKMCELFANVYQMINEWYEEESSAIQTNSPLLTHPISPFLNIYMWPKELDYEHNAVLPTTWERVDGFVRTTTEAFEIPEELKDKPGKLVFLSMGSIGCSHIKLMERLVAILSKSDHKFIVCKGPVGDKYELADNMWGQEFVPQTELLPLVDIVITHGGNNTVTETFFYGKPMLVMPLFADQYDNAQRIQETGLGLRLDPFQCTEEELLSAIDQLANDQQLMQRMADIGERIRNSDDKRKIADMIENLA